ncbi:MAG TPA: H-X9-DG-CTERM domain-containing protein [Abditibacteriaceae bacterium]|jgi:prepilin-type processing-associated H-X9-DG protein
MKTTSRFIFPFRYRLLLVIGGFFLCRWWVLAIKQPELNRRNCIDGLRSISNAMAQYRNDNDGRFVLNNEETPPVLTDWGSWEPRRGWANEVQPYLRSTSLLYCPSAHFAGHSPERDYTSYWLNANLVGIAANRVTRPAATFVIGDGNDGTERADATYSLKKFPNPWLMDKTKPPFRHQGGANYIFADGHVAWLTPQQAARPDGKHDGFSVH